MKHLALRRPRTTSDDVSSGKGPLISACRAQTAPAYDRNRGSRIAWGRDDVRPTLRACCDRFVVRRSPRSPFSRQRWWRTTGLVRLASVDILLENDRCVLATVRNVGLAGWRGAPSAQTFVRGTRWDARFLRVSQRRAGALIVVTGRPDFADDTRRAANKLASEPKIFELGFAHVILMPGLAGSAVRAFISTVLLVARPPAPAKVFANSRDAVAWLASALSAHGWTAEALPSAVDELHQRVQPR